MKREEVIKIRDKILVGMFLLVLLLSFVSAGLGIKWSQESAIISESSKKVCLNYQVYNPWPEDSYAKIQLSSELNEVVSSIEAETKYIPANTGSSDAIPIEFCFKATKVFERDCSLFNKFLCELDCEGVEMKLYTGEVEIIEAPGETGGKGGSATSMSVSAPLKIGVKCISSARNYSLIYIIVGLLAAILLLINILTSKKKSNKKNK